MVEVAILSLGKPSALMTLDQSSYLFFFLSDVSRAEGDGSVNKLSAV